MARRGRLVLWASVLTASLITLVDRVSAAPADAPVTYRAVAAAEGVRTTVDARGAPLSDQIVDVASPVAQAESDSTRGDTALASALYPGDLIVTAPGLVAGFTGGQVDQVPEYPLVAVASPSTQPERRVDGPGTSMHATTDDGEADAQVTVGTGTTDAGIRSSIVAGATTQVQDNGTVTAAATSDVSGITIGPLTIGRIDSSAHATLATDDTLTTDSSFEVTGVSVAGIPAKLTREGLVVADTATPLSSDTVEPILDDAGLDIAVAEEERTDHGVVSGGLTITRTQDLPGAVTPATVTHTVGRATAQVSAASLPGADALDVDRSSTTPTETVSGNHRPRGTAAAAPTASTTIPEASAVVSEPATRAQPVPTPVSTGGESFDMTIFYLVLVTAGAAGGMVLELLRHLGVRLTWN